MNSKATVVAVNEDANIYVVVDERGQTIGSGSRDVCELLAKMASSPTTATNGRTFPRTSLDRENIRSAIKV